MAILKKMEAAGGNLREAKFCGRAHIGCTVGDAAACIYLDWIKDDIHKDPDVQSNWIPTGGVLPTAAPIGPLLMEANWIIHHCSGFRNDVHYFVGGTVPAIGPPIIGVNPPVVPVPVHDASVAGNFLIEALQNPPLAYVTINSLGTGTFICTLQYTWSNVVVHLQVFKG